MSHFRFKLFRILHATHQELADLNSSSFQRTFQRCNRNP